MRLVWCVRVGRLLHYIIIVRRVNIYSIIIIYIYVCLPPRSYIEAIDRPNVYTCNIAFVTRNDTRHALYMVRN